MRVQPAYLSYSIKGEAMKRVSQWVARRIAKFLRKEDGPTAVEYAVMLMLIVVVCIAAISTLGKNANAAFSYVGSSIQAAQGQ